MYRTTLLVVTALGEAATGLLLLVQPSLMLSILLGIGTAAPETLLIGRIAGAALLAFGVACWAGRRDNRRGLLTAVLIYDIAAAALLAYAGLGLNLTGIALWPAVVLHAALAVWCAVAWRQSPVD